MPTHLEVPIFGPAASALATIVAGGAARLELNAAGSYPAGGLTPSLEEAAQLQGVQVPVRVMIRPRGPPLPAAAAPAEGGGRQQRDFLYSDAEIDGMVRSIAAFKASGALRVERGDGFVFGALAETERETETEMEGGGGGRRKRLVLQIETVQRLVEASRPYKTVFHRAFDEIVGAAAEGVAVVAVETEWEKALGSLIQLGVDGILTSGGPGNAAQNIPMLRKIMAKAGDAIEIIVGGGVRSGNVGELCSQLDMSREGGRHSWVHSSCLTGGGKEEVDVAEVQKILGEIK